MSASEATAQELGTLHKIIQGVEDRLIIVLVVLGLIIAIAYRDTWWGPIYRRTFGTLRIAHFSDTTCGKICSCLCPCFMSKDIHIPLRLRILCQYATTLRETGGLLDTVRGRRMEAVWEINAGYNPKKTTSAQRVSRSKETPTEWNEFIDLDLQPGDVVVEVNILNAADDQEVIGSTTIIMSELLDPFTLKSLKNDHIARKGPEEYKLKYKGIHAGMVVMSFIFKPAGEIFEDGLSEALLVG